MTLFRHGTRDDRDATEHISAIRPPDWDATGTGFAGASGTGLPDGGEPVPPSRPDGERFADPRTWSNHKKLPGTDTAPLDRLRAQGQHPATFPALPADPRDTGPMQRMPRFTRVRQRPRPPRPYDAAIFTWSDLIEQFIMLCGTCPPGRRSRYADPIAATMPFAFDALRQSAYVMGWRLDAFARWACPACQAGPDYRAPYGVILWDADAADAYMAGSQDRESRWRAAAELDLIGDVAASAGTGRHRAVKS